MSKYVKQAEAMLEKMTYGEEGHLNFSSEGERFAVVYRSSGAYAVIECSTGRAGTFATAGRAAQFIEDCYTAIGGAR